MARGAGGVGLGGGGSDRESVLVLGLLPVGGGRALSFAGGDVAGEVDGVAVEEEFFGQRRLARIGVRDDREGATAGDFGGG